MNMILVKNDQASLIFEIPTFIETRRHSLRKIDHDRNCFTNPLQSDSGLKWAYFLEISIFIKEIKKWIEVDPKDQDKNKRRSKQT